MTAPPDLLPIDYSKIAKLPRIALWPKHLYHGTVTMFAGASGVGKGLTGIHATAVVVKGGLFPGESEDTDRDRTPGSVLGVWPEDDPNEDLAWRLDSALDGAGLSTEEKARVYDMTETADGEPFELNQGGTESVARLWSVIEDLQYCDGSMPVCKCGREHEFARYPVKLVLIDPLLAVCDTIQTNKQARKTLRPLMKMAKATGVAVLVIHHTVKDGKTIAGSKGLIDTLRLVFKIEHDKYQDDICVLRVEKSNNLGHISELRYTIAGTDSEPYLNWLDAPVKTSKPKPVTKQGPLRSVSADGRYNASWRSGQRPAPTPKQAVPDGRPAPPQAVPAAFRRMP